MVSKHLTEYKRGFFGAEQACTQTKMNDSDRGDFGLLCFWLFAQIPDNMVDKEGLHVSMFSCVYLGFFQVIRFPPTDINLH